MRWCNEVVKITSVALGAVGISRIYVYAGDALWVCVDDLRFRPYKVATTCLEHYPSFGAVPIDPSGE